MTRIRVTAALGRIVPLLALFAAAGFTSSAAAHAALVEPSAVAGSYHKASVRIGHGCEGSPTVAVRVFVPAGLEGAKPQPKPDWDVSLRKVALERPYTSHGKTVTEDVAEIEWRVRDRARALPDGQFDEFAFFGRLPDRPGLAWVRVLQTCEQGQLDWAERPAEGASTRGLKAPAALLRLLPPPSEPVALPAPVPAPAPVKAPAAPAVPAEHQHAH